MQTEFDAAPQPAKLWPDFYSILHSTPETDADTLRKTINTMYVQANTQLDHRELSRRFYFQVLSQKVLPQCRRVLLDKEIRLAYDEQWHLHRSGVASALSYNEFIVALSKKSNIDTTTLLTDSELAILPSFENGSASVPGVTDCIPAMQHEGATTSTVEVAPPTSFPPIEGPAATTDFTKKKSNLPVWGGLAAMGVALAGAFLWNSSRPSDEETGAPTSALASTQRAHDTVKAPDALPSNVDVSLHTPLTINLDSIPGTVEGDAKIGPGLDGQGLVFNGTGGIELSQTLDTSQSYTVMAWVKVIQTPQMQNGLTPFETFVSADGPQQSAFFLQLRGDTHRFGFAALPEKGAPLATFAGASSGYQVNVWYHLAGVYDASQQTMALYVNGALQNTVSYTGAYRSSGTLRLGRAKFNGKAVDFMSGTLDNVQIFQKALSAPQIFAVAKPLLAKAHVK